MKRRTLLSYSGALLTGGLASTKINTRKSFALEYKFDIDSQTSFSYTDTPNLYLSFSKFNIKSENIDLSSPVKIRVNTGLENNKLKERTSETFENILDSRNQDISEELNNRKLALTDSDLISKLNPDKNGYSFELDIQLEIECDSEIRTTTKKTITINILAYESDSHVLNTESFSQKSANDGTLSNSSEWKNIISETITTNSKPVLIDFHTTVVGGSHDTFSLRLVINGKQTTIVKQTDSDSSLRKMVSIFDVVELSSGQHNIEVEWKGTGSSWNIDTEAVLNTLELNTEGNSSYVMSETDTGSITNSWEPLISETYTVKKNSVLIFKSFLSPHVNYDANNSWNKTRITVNGETVCYSRSGESNDGYIINALMGSGKYSEGESITVNLEWKKDRNNYVLEGNTARLGIFEFGDVDKYDSSRSTSGSAPTRNWNTLDKTSINNSENILYNIGHMSAAVSNNRDFSMRLQLNGDTKAWQTTGVSDDDAYDNLLISSINRITGDIDIETQWTAEGYTGLVQSNLASISLRKE